MNLVIAPVALVKKMILENQYKIALRILIFIPYEPLDYCEYNVFYLYKSLLYFYVESMFLYLDLFLTRVMLFYQYLFSDVLLLSVETNTLLH